MHDSTEPDCAKSTEAKQKVRASEQPVASRTRRLSSASSRVNLEMSDTLGCSVDDSNVRSIGGLSKVDSIAKAPTVKKIAEMYQKDPLDRSEQEVGILKNYAHLIPLAEVYLKSKQEKEILRQRLLEVEESCESIEAKTEILAKLIQESRHVVIYTGAGISTSASIPDYRGPNGLWTQIKRTGTFSITKVLDLSNAEPTYTHMAIKELCRRRIVKHVVSQNCDGLHLRSGVAQTNLSEIHGNMYIEVCPTCERQYYREADVTQRTCRFRHKTGRRCHTCLEPNNNLIDTIVLYGERSRSKWPMNWERAGAAAKNADLIICMGSSLKTLRRYGCLWPTSSTRKARSETKLVIINLQHTPKDKNAFMKINGKCDFVMENVMRRLGIEVPAYEWTCDPLLCLAVPFTVEELAGLKRNLIFDSKRHHKHESSSTPPPNEASLSPSSLKRQRSEENRDSPSLFVSELTDDPDKKRLRMRIRAVNLVTVGSCKAIDENDSMIIPAEVKREPEELETKAETIETSEQNEFRRRQLDEHNYENLLSQPDLKQLQHQRVVEYSPPGWLGKSLGYSRSSSYRRKRHGNKGRKRALATDTAEPAAATTSVPASVPQQA